MSIGVDAAAKGTGDVPEIGVGMLGYAFMGKAHANGYKTLPYMEWPPPLRPRLVSIAGRDEAAVSEAAQRYVVRLCQLIGARLGMISIGPERDQVIMLTKVF